MCRHVPGRGDVSLEGKGKLGVTYIPTGGVANTLTQKVKLVKK